jgi:hypothetical protein
MEKMKSHKLTFVRAGAAMGRFAAVTGLGVVLVATSTMAAQAAPKASQSPGPAPSARLAPSARPAAVPRALCDSIDQLDRLVVRRLVALPGNHLRFSFPAVVTVSDLTAVQDAAKAVCALPVMPRKPMSCPVDLGITYRLSFSGQLPPVNQAQSYGGLVASATGCEVLTGLAWTRWAARSPKFWPELGKAMGLKHPTWGTFRGSGGAPG